MTNRIPTSLNWLIKKRARIDGQIKATNRALKKVQVHVIRLRELEDTLRAIDNALKLHEIQVDVNNIKSVRPQERTSKFAYGEINTLILKYLRLHAEREVPTPEIQHYIFQQHLILDQTPLNHGILSTLVSLSLGRLCRHGCVIRGHDVKTNEIGSWKAVKM